MTSPTENPAPDRPEAPGQDQQPTPPPDPQPGEAVLHEDALVDDAVDTPPVDESADEEEGQGEERGLPAGGVLVGGATGLTVLGEVLWQAFGLTGLAVSVVVAAGGVALYTISRVRRGRRNGFGSVGSRRTSARMLSGGKGGRMLPGGKAGRLFGGKGGRLQVRQRRPQYRPRRQARPQGHRCGKAARWQGRRRRKAVRRRPCARRGIAAGNDRRRPGPGIARR